MSLYITYVIFYNACSALYYISIKIYSPTLMNHVGNDRLDLIK